MITLSKQKPVTFGLSGSLKRAGCLHKSSVGIYTHGDLCRRTIPVGLTDPISRKVYIPSWRSDSNMPFRTKLVRSETLILTAINLHPGRIYTRLELAESFPGCAAKGLWRKARPWTSSSTFSFFADI